MEKIAFIGAGIMGKWMIRNLMRNGYEMTVYDVRSEAVEDLVEEGAFYRGSLADTVKKQDAVITMVTTPAVVEALDLGKGGIIENADEGTYLVDMTTTEPSLEKIIFQKAKERGLHFMDAPVTGGDTGARDGILSILAGGEEEDCEACRKVLSCMGSNINYQGPIGSGQHTKMANQILLAGILAGMAESVAYAKAHDLNTDAYYRAVSTGAAASRQLDINGPKMLEGDFSAGFFIKHFVKDMRIAAKEADAISLDLPVLKDILHEYERLADAGLNEAGMQALLKYYE